jgi:urease accessory protein
MGAAAARITADDFLTPPELRPWRLAPDPAGRIGGVRAELVAEAGGTLMGDCYQQVPLRVLPPFGFGPDRPALMYLLNPTAGLMDGDGHRIDLTARTGSRAIVVGQSATRIHPSLVGFSTQQWRLRVEAGATLAVLPGPAIPFRGCRYYQHVEVDLEPGAGFLWSDVWLPGRYARGVDSERFVFDRVIQSLTVRRAGRRVFRDRFCWAGPWDNATADWQFGRADACGSLFVTGPVAAGAHPASASVDECSFPTAAGDSCVRWRGPAEAVTAQLVAAAFGLTARLAGGTASRFDPANLAPIHWFSAGLAS